MPPLFLPPLLLGSLLTTPAAPSPAAASLRPDTTTATTPPGRTHLLKLGLQWAGNSGAQPGLGYEWQLRPRLSLQTTLNYTGSTWHGGYDYVNFDNTITSYRFTQRERYLATAAELRYYFQRRQPALTGWYAGAGVKATYSRVAYSDGSGSDRATTTFGLQPQLRLGRQWALGRRLTLDTYLGANLQPRTYYYGPFQHAWRVAPVLGFSLGYRF